MDSRLLTSRPRKKTSSGCWLQEKESVEGSNMVSQDKDDRKTEEGNYFTTGATTELLCEIFSRLAPPTLFKFRLVSKSLCDLIKDSYFVARHFRHCKAIAGNGVTGFFLQGDRDSWCCERRKEILWLLVESEAGGLPDPSLQFLKQQKKYDKVEIFDSCNGLLLCMIRNVAGKIKTCLICNPLTKQKLVLPLPLSHPRVPWNRLSYALMADYSKISSYFSYKIVCLLRPKLDDPCQCPGLAIWSSETGEWQVFDGKFPPLNARIQIASKVFYNGSLYWDCLEGHILVCHLNIEHKQQPCFQLIEAPQATFGRCLWKSANKLHCYCFEIGDIYPDWTLDMNEKQELKWQLQDGEQFRALSEDVSTLKESWMGCNVMGATSKIPFKVMAYAPESKTMFLLASHCIYEYQVTKRTLEILSDPQEFVVSYVHSLVTVHTGDVMCSEGAKTKYKDSQRDKSEASACILVNKMKMKGGSKKRAPCF